MACFVLMCR